MSKQPKSMGQMPPKRKLDTRVLVRVLKLVFSAYPVLLPVTCGCIVLSAIVSSIPAIFTQKVLKIIDRYLDAGNTDWASAKEEIVPLVVTLIIIYSVAMILITLYNQLMAYITHGFLHKIRCKMFDGMQNLPVKYFDTHKHGDIMSYYTNDIDTLRQLVSQSLPSLLQSGVIVLSVLGIMLWYSLWMTMLVLIGVTVIVVV